MHLSVCKPVLHIGDNLFRCCSLFNFFSGLNKRVAVNPSVVSRINDMNVKFSFCIGIRFVEIVYRHDRIAVGSRAERGYRYINKVVVAIIEVLLVQLLKLKCGYLRMGREIL